MTDDLTKSMLSSNTYLRSYGSNKKAIVREGRSHGHAIVVQRTRLQKLLQENFDPQGFLASNKHHSR
jgi:hypothetical protein